MTKFKEKARTISPFGGGWGEEKQPKILPPAPSKAGVIGSEFRTNFILFDSPEGVNFTNLGCQPQDRNSRYHLALTPIVMWGRNFKLYRPFRAGEVDLFRAMG